MGLVWESGPQANFLCDVLSHLCKKQTVQTRRNWSRGMFSTYTWDLLLFYRMIENYLVNNYSFIFSQAKVNICQTCVVNGENEEKISPRPRKDNIIILCSSFLPRCECPGCCTKWKSIICVQFLPLLDCK
jgi:hypothetical protein